MFNINSLFDVLKTEMTDFLTATLQLSCSRGGSLLPRGKTVRQAGGGGGGGAFPQTS